MLNKNTKFKKFNTVLFKMTASYVLIVILSVLLIGILGNSIYKFYFNKQIETSNSIILDSFKDFIDKDILEKADEMYLNIIANDKNYLHHLDFDSNGAIDYKKIKNLSNILSEYQVLNADWCMNIYIYEAETDIFVGTNGIIGDQMRKAGEKPYWFDDMIETERGFFYLPTISLESIFSYSRQNGCILMRTIPQANDIKKKSYLFCEISEEIFAMTMNKVVQDDSTMLIADEYGNVISTTEKTKYPYKLEGQEYFNKILKLNSRSGFFECKVNGVKSIVSYSTIDRYDWKVISIKDSDIYYRASKLTGLMIFVVCLITVVLVVLISNFLTKSIYNPMRDIIRKISRTSKKSDINNEYEIIEGAFADMSGTITRLEGTLENNKPFIKNNLVHTLIYNEVYSLDTINELLELCGKKNEGKYYNAAIIEFSGDISKKFSQRDISVMLYNIIDEIENLDNDNSSYLAAQIGINNIVVIGMHKINKTAELLKDAQYLEDYITSNYFLNCVMVFGDVVNTPIELNKSYKCADTALKYKFLMPKQIVVFGAEVIQRENSNAVLPDSYVVELKKHLNSENVSGCKKTIHTILKELIKGDYKASYCNKKMLEIVSLVSAYMKERNIKSSDLLYEASIGVFDKVGDVYDFEEWLGNLIERVKMCAESNTKHNSVAVVEKAKAYIEENMASDLSLNMVAERVFMSPQYLSKIFKEHIGMNFSEYVAKVRMDKAAELLLKENLSVENIAAMVGYNTPHYFIKKFKERYGVTPKIYRTNNNNV